VRDLLLVVRDTPAIIAGKNMVVNCQTGFDRRQNVIREGSTTAVSRSLGLEIRRWALRQTCSFSPDTAQLTPMRQSAPSSLSAEC